jgi:L,D-transpeptidase ErfK/SrfK
MRIPKCGLPFSLLFSLFILIPFGAAGFPATAMGTTAPDTHMYRPLELRVSLSSRTLEVVEYGSVVQTYSVAVGRASNPTPTGRFRTGRIEWNPSWTPPPRNWARGMSARGPGDPRNPMQVVKIYFREPWYFIHGTNDPASIGQAASRGCLRMRPNDAEELARLIERHGSGVPLIVQR